MSIILKVKVLYGSTKQKVEVLGNHCKGQSTNSLGTISVASGAPSRAELPLHDDELD